MSDWASVDGVRPRKIGEFIRYHGNLCSNGSWSGFRLAQGEVQPGRLPEGYLLTHLVSLHLGKPATIERYVAGQRRRTEMVTLDLAADRVRQPGSLHDRISANPGN